MTASAGADQVLEAHAPLRIGVLLDGFEQPVWVAHLLQEIAESPEFEISLIVLNQAASEPRHQPSPHRLRRWWQNRNALPYALYRRIDRKRYRVPGDPEDSAVVTELFADCPVVGVSPRMTKHCDYFGDDAVAKIRSYDLDVLLRFGFRILKGDVLQAAKYGVWSFHHGDNRQNRGGPAGFWEVMRQEPVTGAVLQVLSEELDAGLVIGRSFASTEPISVTANKHNYYWQATHLLTASLRRLHQRGAAFLEDIRGSREWESYSQPLFVEPGARQMLRLGIRLALRLATRKVRDLFVREQWILAYRLQPHGCEQGNVPDGTLYRFKELIPPPDRFWADPMPVYRDGKYYLFFEEYILGTPKAHISVFEMGTNGTLGPARIVLERPYHLSYPFVFSWDGQYYMIPETAKRCTVELYRAVQFPDQWELERVLLEGIAATDATVAEIDGRWWMFVGISPTPREAGLLNLYSATSPLGPWEPHAMNPVKMDVRSTRPAGPLFFYNGRWYRPSQCGAPGYGSSIVINRIDELSQSTFEESEVGRISPTWRPGLNGAHTIAAAAGLTVVDARRVVSRF